MCTTSQSTFLTGFMRISGCVDGRGFRRTRTHASFLSSDHRQTRTVTISPRLGRAWRILPWALLGEGAAANLRLGVRHQGEAAGCSGYCAQPLPVRTRQPVTRQLGMSRDTHLQPGSPQFFPWLPSQGMRRAAPAQTASPQHVCAGSQGPWAPRQTARLKHTLEPGNLPEKAVKF